MSKSKAVTKPTEEDKAKAAQAKADAVAKIVDRELPAFALDVNTRLEKAAQMDGKADDHRLAASLQIAKAAEKCKLAGIAFEKWATDNIKGSWESTRKLLAVGRAPEPAKALADLRGKVKVANAKLRAKKKAGEQVSRETSTTRTRPDSPFAVAEHALEAVEDTQRLKVVEATAAKLGMAVISKTDAAEFRRLKSEPEQGFAGAQFAFEALGPSDKVSFVEWAAKEIGATVAMPVFNAEEALEVPEALKRTVKRK